MTRPPVAVRLEIYEGDELADVMTVHCDAATAAALEEFRATGSCTLRIMESLRALMPLALPGIPGSLESLDRQLREDLCSGYLQSRAVPVDAELCFRLQKN
jgi:hypothetical protein